MRSIVVAALLGLPITTVSPARAAQFDLTGTWSGTVKCKVFSPQPATSTMNPATLQISQSGIQANALLVGNSAYSGQVQENVVPGTGAVALTECSTDTPLPNFNELLSAKVSISPSTRKPANAHLVGVSTFGIGGQLIAGVCNWKLTRSDTTDPGVQPCPNRCSP